MHRGRHGAQIPRGGSKGEVSPTSPRSQKDLKSKLEDPTNVNLIVTDQRSGIA